MFFVASRALFFPVLSVNTLGPADFASKGDHLRDIDAKGAVAAGTQHTAVPDDITDFFEGSPIDLSPLFI